MKVCDGRHFEIMTYNQQSDHASRWIYLREEHSC